MFSPDSRDGVSQTAALSARNRRYPTDTVTRPLNNMRCSRSDRQTEIWSPEKRSGAGIALVGVSHACTVGAIVGSTVAARVEISVPVHATKTAA